MGGRKWGGVNQPEVNRSRTKIRARIKNQQSGREGKIDRRFVSKSGRGESIRFQETKKVTQLRRQNLEFSGGQYAQR